MEWSSQSALMQSLPHDTLRSLALGSTNLYAGGSPGASP